MDRILEDREKRYYKILDLIDKNKLPVVCGKLNYPGKNKNTKEADMAFEIMSLELKRAFNKYSLESVITDGYDGKALLIVLKLDPKIAKVTAIKLEETHPLGRVFDVDVYLEDGSSLSRFELGGSERGCIVCGEKARQCIKEGRHEPSEVVDCINRLIHSCRQQH